jgi:hypothetical protein
MLRIDDRGVQSDLPRTAAPSLCATLTYQIHDHRAHDARGIGHELATVFQFKTVGTQLMIREVRGAEHFFEAHEELVQIVLSGDVEKACVALRDHLQRTLMDVYSHGRDVSDLGQRSESALGGASCSFGRVESGVRDSLHQRHAGRRARVIPIA